MSKEIISEFESSQLVYNHIKYADLTRNVIGPQTHDVFEILYLKNGDLTYQVEGKKYRVQKNAMIVTRPCFSHVLTLNSTKIYERYDFLFENKVVSESVLKKLPDEMKPYVERLDFILGAQAAAPYNCGVISFKDRLYINFIRDVQETGLEYRFFKVLQEEGLSVMAQSNHSGDAYVL